LKFAGDLTNNELDSENTIFLDTKLAVDKDKLDDKIRVIYTISN